MRTVTFRCPSCQEIGRASLESNDSVSCEYCDVEVIAAGKKMDEQRLSRCVIWQSPEMFVRKDFPQRLGVTIVVLGFAASCITWYYEWIISTYAILFGTALIDVVLYFCMGNVLECYRCHAHFRGIPELESHDPFNLEVHEKHRQNEARLKEAEADQAYREKLRANSAGQATEPSDAS